MLASGKSGILTARDQKIFADLYLAPCQTTEQIALAHFRTKDGEVSEGAAERRLYRLAGKGYLETRSIDTPQGNRIKVWVLTEEAWYAEHRDLVADTDGGMVIPRPGRLEHFIATNDLYAATSNDLRKHFGEPAPEDPEGWNWRHEYLCEHEATVGSQHRKVKPDAEVSILDTTLYVETQTDRSHKSTTVMENKVEGYGSYFNYVLKQEEDKNQLLVITNEPWIKRAVEKKGEQLGIMVVAGVLDEVSRHVEMTALRLS